MTLCPKWWHKDRHPVLLYSANWENQSFSKVVICSREVESHKYVATDAAPFKWCLWFYCLGPTHGLFCGMERGPREPVLDWAALIHQWCRCSHCFFFFGCFSCSVLLFNSCCLPVPLLTDSYSSLLCPPYGCGSWPLKDCCFSFTFVVFLAICLSAINMPDNSISLLGWKNIKCAIL